MITQVVWDRSEEINHPPHDDTENQPLNLLQEEAYSYADDQEKESPTPWIIKRIFKHLVHPIGAARLAKPQVYTCRTKRKDPRIAGLFWVKFR
jgi:hypothetical protein